MAETIGRLLLFLWMASTLMNQVRGCSDTWKSFQGSCYLFPGETSRSLSWAGASRQCRKYGAELVSIGSAKENRFITKQIFELPHSPLQIWIGNKAKSRYIWSDGSRTTYENWYRGEPNDLHGQEDCVAIMRANGFWNDDNCLKSYQFVCEKREDANPPTSIQLFKYGKCPDGFMSEISSNKCFKVMGTGDQDGKGWSDANDECRRQGAELASISSTTEQSFVLLLIEAAERDVWIGFYKQGSLYHWTDNSSIEFNNFYLLYRPHSSSCGKKPPRKPANQADKECIAIDRTPNQVGRWVERDCLQQLAFICQAHKEESTEVDPDPFDDQYSDPACPDDYFWYHSRCYKFYDDAKTWPLAKKTCDENGGMLAITEDMFEVARLYYEIMKPRDGRQHRAWIGASFNEEKRDYRWGPNNRVRATFWADHDPGKNPHATCVYLMDGAWHDKICDHRLPFLCMSANSSLNSDAMPSSNSPPRMDCPQPEQISFGDHCYYTPSDGKVSWFEARAKCETFGMQLVSIHSMEENNFVLGLVEEQSMWIGLYQNLYEGHNRWIDNSPFNYRNWYPGEPNQMVEECAEIFGDAARTAQWNDLDCDHLRRYVCKTDKVHSLTTKSTTSATASLTQTSLPGSATSTPTIPQPTDIIPSSNSPPGMHCPKSEHISFGDHCYFTPQQYFLSWFAARAKCETFGMQLVSIHSMKENNFVLGLVSNQDMWIGLHQDHGEGFNRWIDDSPMNFCNWAPGEPNRMDEKCAEMYGNSFAQWNDVDCDLPHRYVCKTDKVPLLKTTASATAATASPTKTSPPASATSTPTPTTPQPTTIMSTTKTRPTPTEVAATTTLTSTPATSSASPPHTSGPTATVFVSPSTTASSTPSASTRRLARYSTLSTARTKARNTPTTPNTTTETTASQKSKLNVFTTATSTKIRTGSGAGPNIAETRESASSPQSSGMTRGEVAATVICVLVGAIILASVSFLIITKRWTSIVARLCRKEDTSYTISLKNPLIEFN